MKKFIVTVNGNRYEVEVEEVTVSVPAAQAATAAPEAGTIPKDSDAAAKAGNAAGSQTSGLPKTEGAYRLAVPMPGTILDIRVRAGQEVRKGQVVAILEAMKMENEILAPKDGIVAGIYVSKNQQVNTGDIIMTLD
mgnify:CR=1 FL=1|jgi:Biotin-requiring enzyme.